MAEESKSQTLTSTTSRPFATPIHRDARGRFPLLSLPKELRLCIYAHIAPDTVITPRPPLYNPSTHALYYGRTSSGRIRYQWTVGLQSDSAYCCLDFRTHSIAPGILEFLQTCRTIHEELSFDLYLRTKFVVTYFTACSDGREALLCTPQFVRLQRAHVVVPTGSDVTSFLPEVHTFVTSLPELVKLTVSVGMTSSRVQTTEALTQADDTYSQLSLSLANFATSSIEERAGNLPPERAARLSSLGAQDRYWYTFIIDVAKFRTCSILKAWVARRNERNE